jgi:hypothetical protein
MKKKRSTYDKDHLIAKVIVATIVSILITLAQLSVLPYSLLLNVAAVYVWFFGVNFTGHVIETILKHKHKHKWF